jgi:ABC-2 type transport system ATP-binding protein
MTAQSNAPPVAAEDLTRDFGSIRAVDDLSFHVEKGEIVGILGPNGAGKTTTLRMLTGSLIPTRGRVLLGGFDVLQNGLLARKHLGYLPEQLPLYGEMIVSEYLRFVGSIKELSEGRLEESLQQVRARLDLDAVWDRPTRVISRGYRQRVGLAQALLGDPDLLILDEPTAGLDPNQIHDFRTLVRKLGEDHAVLLSTHILPEALEVCDRVMILNRGQLVAMDRPDRLTGDAAHGRLVTARIRLNRMPETGDPAAKVEQLEQHDLWRLHGTWNEAQANQVLQRLVEQGAAILEWRGGAGGLEEVFRRLTLGEDVS